MVGDDEDMRQPEEEKAEVATSPEALDKAIGDHLTKLKLVDLMSKAIDHFTAVAQTDKDFFLSVETSLITLISKFLKTITSLKPKSFTQFVTKTINDSAVKAQSEIIDFFSKLKDVDRIMKMEVDHIVESA